MSFQESLRVILVMKRLAIRVLIIIDEKTATTPNWNKSPTMKLPIAPPTHPKKPMIPTRVATALALPFKDLWPPKEIGIWLNMIVYVPLMYTL